MPTESFHQTLGVSPDTEPDEVRSHSREYLDTFRGRIEDAEDSDAERRRLAIAFEVITDSKERYLYELFGHDKYVARRLDDEEAAGVESTRNDRITDIFETKTDRTDTKIFDPTADATDTQVFISDTAAADVTGTKPVVDSDGDETADTERTESRDPPSLADITVGPTLQERLSEFPLSESPIGRAPGLRNETYRPLAATGYGAAALCGIATVGTLMPFGSAEFGVFAALGLLISATATYTAGSLRYRRKLWYRSAVGVVSCLLLLAVLEFGVTISVPKSVVSVGTLAAGLLGVAASNTYIAATRRAVRKRRNADNGRGGRNYAATDPTTGVVNRDIDAASILKRFEADNSGLTGASASDLAEAATVYATRRFVPKRHVVRRLFVRDERTSREIPISEFPTIESNLRDDVDRRNRHHPSGFTEQTDEYLVPRSVNERTCPNCAGNARVTCPTCGGSGKVACGRCDGGQRNMCGNCRGKGRVSSGDRHQDCQQCGGEGYGPCGRCSATGTEACGGCGGDGTVACNRCEGDARVVEYTTLIRKYTPDEEVTYENSSIPVDLLTTSDGNLVEKNRNQTTDPNAEEGDVFMEEHEVREIPTDVVTYEYAGDLWELYEIEGEVKANAYPRALGVRVQASAATTVVAFILFVYVSAVGPSGLL